MNIVGFYKYQYADLPENKGREIVDNAYKEFNFTLNQQGNKQEHVIFRESCKL